MAVKDEEKTQQPEGPGQTPRGGKRLLEKVLTHGTPTYLPECPTGCDPDAVEETPQGLKYLVFAGMAVILLVMGFVLTPSLPEIWAGFKRIATHPITLDFDALYWAENYGTAFVNAGIMLLLVLATYRLTKTDLQGVQIAAMMMATGFSFYGKNPVNVWFPIFGVCLHAFRHRRPLREDMALAWFSTSLAPIFNVMAFGTDALPSGSPQAILLGILFAVVGGYIVAVLGSYLPRLHKGRLLYNAGFAAGLAGTFANAFQKTLGLGHDKFPYLDEQYIHGENGLLTLLLIILFAYLIIVGLVLGGAKRYRRMLWLRCFGGNFIQQFGFGTSLINMGVIGLASCLYVDLTSVGQLNGPVYACIFTAAGFAAAGVTIREFIPTLAGVALSSFLGGGINALLVGGNFLDGGLLRMGSRSMLLAAIFSCGLAPVVGTFGWLAGVFVGMVHSFLVPLTGSLHGWMSLYNNGFSMGIIVVFIFPMYSRLKIGKREREVHIGPED